MLEESWWTVRVQPKVRLEPILGQPVKQREPTFAIFNYSMSKVKSLNMSESPALRDALNTREPEEESPGSE